MSLKAKDYQATFRSKKLRHRKYRKDKDKETPQHRRRLMPFGSGEIEHPDTGKAIYDRRSGRLTDGYFTASQDELRTTLDILERERSVTRRKKKQVQLDSTINIVRDRISTVEHKQEGNEAV